MSQFTSYSSNDLAIRNKQALTQRYLQNPLSVRWSKLAAIVQANCDLEWNREDQ